MDSELPARPPSGISPKVLYPLFCVLALPNLFPDAFFRDVMFGLQIALLGVYALLLSKIPRRSASKPKSKFVLAFVLVFHLSFVISLVNKSIKIHEFFYFNLVTFFIYRITLAIATGDEEERPEWMNALFLSLSIYVAVCVLLYFAGVTSAKDIQMYEPQSRIGYLFGFKERVNFPFTPGMNSFAVLVGLSILGLLQRWIHQKNRSTYVAVGILLPFSLFAIVASDSRGPLAYIFIAYLVISLMRYSFKTFLASAGALLGALGYFLTHLTDNSDLLLAIVNKLSGRAVIWAFAVANLIPFRPLHLFGYGLFGQTASEVCYKYGWLFSAYRSSTVERISLHNVFLQYLYDFGYVGLSICIVIFGFTLFRLSKGKGPRQRTALAALVYLLLCGFTEPVPSIYLLPAFFILIFILQLQRPLESTSSPAPLYPAPLAS